MDEVVNGPSLALNDAGMQYRCPAGKHAHRRRNFPVGTTGISHGAGRKARTVAGHGANPHSAVSREHGAVNSSLPASQ
ncbi:hypothetical protein NEOLEDRAFT_1184929 [Neolentinus lepideus HHB14362 ss-1]|uniref:Uncharacterized protein n=1 Tax=Neolentinus lepideus HHB14362 ss-1 TaxID=1314782 RepID=A0A165JAT5_9AGAM|nr:hypothetical protein NEOLEDRAFT_1184929 [Neolentinus lepideus HHB14362 ss-1]